MSEKETKTPPRVRWQINDFETFCKHLFRLSFTGKVVATYITMHNSERTIKYDQKETDEETQKEMDQRNYDLSYVEIRGSFPTKTKSLQQRYEFWNNQGFRLERDVRLKIWDNKRGKKRELTIIVEEHHVELLELETTHQRNIQEGRSIEEYIDRYPEAHRMNK
jgi:hypothetical protein